MEPLNTITNHPNIFMRTITQGYLVAKGVNSPGVKVPADLYHAQIQAGNLIPTLDSCWDEIPYIQVGDNPGLLEPGRSEEHTSELQSLMRISYAVFCLKKKK